MNRYTFDVDMSTHDALRRGVTALATSRVAVWAKDINEAALIAAQMPAARGYMPTQTLWVASDEDFWQTE